jgi:hypothetical protein
MILPSIKDEFATVEPARSVVFEILFPAPILHPAPITTFGPIMLDGSILAVGSIITLPLIFGPVASLSP